MASKVRFLENFDNWVVGDNDKQHKEFDSNVISGIKVSLQGKVGDSSDVRIVCHINGHSRQFQAVVLASYILLHLKECAQDYLKRNAKKLKTVASDTFDIKRVVLGMPATLSSQGQGLLRTAAMLAGFEEVCTLLQWGSIYIVYGVATAVRTLHYMIAMLIMVLH